MTLGSCLSSYTAQNIGAGKAERIPLGFRTGLKLSAVASIPFVVLYVGFSRQMMGLFLNAESVGSDHSRNGVPSDSCTLVSYDRSKN